MKRNLRKLLLTTVYNGRSATIFCVTSVTRRLLYTTTRCLSLHVTLTLRRCYVLLLVSYIFALLLRTFVIVICWRCYTLPTNFDSASRCDINICTELTLSLIRCIDCFDILHNFLQPHFLKRVTIFSVT